MYRFLPLLLSAGLALSGQAVVPPEHVAEVLARVQPAPGAEPIRCDVQALPPALDFGFRYVSGFQGKMPLYRYAGQSRRWSILTTVTPTATGQPVYLLADSEIPEGPQDNLELSFAGYYRLGEGEYRVDWRLTDENGRSCGKSWTTQIERGRGTRDIALRIPPNTVWGQNSPELVAGPDVGRADGRPLRVAVLLHAAPVNARAVQMRGRDLVVLDALAAALETLPVSSVRLTAFSLQQQTELGTWNALEKEDWPAIERAMATQELGKIDLQTLADGPGPNGLLTRLIERERSAAEPADVVLVVGPAMEADAKAALETGGNGPGPRFFYLQYRRTAPARVIMDPFARRGYRGPVLVPGASFEYPDTIQRSLGQIGGETLTFRTPQELVGALGKIGRKLQTKTGAGAPVRSHSALIDRYDVRGR